MTILLKWLLVLVVILIVLMWIKGAQGTRARNSEADDATRPKGASRRKPRVAAPSPMVSCAHCGLNLPLEEAVPGDAGSGVHFCSQAHRREHARHKA